MKTFLKTAALAAALLSGTSAFARDSDSSAIAGRWDAVLTRGGVEIPFRLDIKEDGSTLKGVLYDGWKPYESTTTATFKDGTLLLDLEHYLTTINAKLENGRLNGTVFSPGPEGSNYGFRATRHVDIPAAAGAQAPSIAGKWEIPLATPSSKGENAFRSSCSSRGRKSPHRSCASMAIPEPIWGRLRTGNGCSATSTAAVPA